ncbi:TetR/AcrR family transcriptional regulator [Gudongella sp. SC589]|jgi:AcrR family transcriptional regulator|uniref:TetR/AcrR family transcriptional regulator n=1 Tax=Gudongella sp. SC589 TaxID=3385990 RepID=UPI003904D52C
MAGIREERRDQIIQAAIRVFGKKGFHRAKIGEIAQEAEIGKSTVYEYFDSKKDLFEEMIRFIAQDYYDDVNEALSEGKGCKSRLLSFANNHGSFIKSHMELAENTMTDSTSVSEDIKKEMLGWKMKIFQLVEDVLKDGIEAGELREGIDTKSATAIILGAINENYVVQCIIFNQKPEEVQMERIIDLIFSGLGKDNSQISMHNSQ